MEDSMKKRITLVLTLLLAALMLAACADDNTTEPLPTAALPEPTPLPPPDEGLGEATAVPAEPTATAEPAAAALTPAVTVADQELSDGTVTIAAVTAAEPGWIVIHADANGAPGPVIGFAPVATGDNENVQVEVDEAGATGTLYAMLHVDAGVAGEYEFPGDDVPARVDGNVVMQPFTLTGGLDEAAAAGAVGLELVAEGLAAPVVFKPVPGETGRFVIVDQIGVAYILDGDGNLLDEPFLDLRDRIVELMADFDERGFLGLAFHPAYAENGRFYVYYSAPLREEAPAGWNHTSHISEFQVSADDANVADPGSERLLLQVDQPQFNHDGGQIAFGPDGYLYIPLGDGGGANDVGLGHVDDWYEFNEGGNAQNITENLLGAILRIDVDAEGTDGQPYGIPADNPFAGDDEVFPEIWAYGFRNPFRISFDRGGDNALYVADAGQDHWEEVSIVEAGGNYGWSVKEATHCFNAAEPDNPPADCPDSDPDGNPLVDPVVEYLNANQEGGLGLVVIGGHVYRGEALPELQGAYVFGDWSDSFSEGNGRLFVATPSDEGLWPVQALAVSNTDSGTLESFLLSFGEDEDGELYVLTSGSVGPAGESGRVYRLVPADSAGPLAMPAETDEEAMAETEEEAAAGEMTVIIDALAFSPAQLTVPVGTTVVWQNEDNLAHTVTAGRHTGPEPERFDSGLFDPGESFSYTFDEAGTFDYYCTIHPAMQATITVEE
jgi:glucose/arabinose dehydrogenase/plastocyanin